MGIPKGSSLLSLRIPIACWFTRKPQGISEQRLFWAQINIGPYILPGLSTLAIVKISWQTPLLHAAWSFTKWADDDLSLTVTLLPPVLSYDEAFFPLGIITTGRSIRGRDWSAPSLSTVKNLTEPIISLFTVLGCVSSLPARWRSLGFFENNLAVWCPFRECSLLRLLNSWVKDATG